MLWFIVIQIFSTLLQWVRLAKISEQEKDLEIRLLRRQLAILQRKVDTPIRVSRAEKLTLVALAARYKSVTGHSVRQLQAVIRIFQPETVFKWHRALVRRKWTYPRKNRGGRPRTEKELEQLIVRLARENSDWVSWPNILIRPPVSADTRVPAFAKSSRDAGHRVLDRIRLSH